MDKNKTHGMATARVYREVLWTIAFYCLPLPEIEPDIKIISDGASTGQFISNRRHLWNVTKWSNSGADNGRLTIVIVRLNFSKTEWSDVKMIRDTK